MNAINQTLLRSILKIGAGYLVAKGITDDNTAEQLTAGLVAIIAIIWGLVHRTPAPTPSTNDSPRPPLSLILAAALLSGLIGCANLSSKTSVIRPDGTREDTKMWGYAIGGADNALAKFHNSPVSMTSSNGWALPAGTTIGTAAQSAQAPALNLGDILGQAMKVYTGKP